ncbi:MAG: phage tail tape measure protein [Roseburia sp.]|nr:phage tail tape measure protein [Roseburia sp.]
MANRKEYAMMFQLQAQMAGGFNGTFSKAQASIASMQKEIQTLNKTQSDIAGYQKQQNAVEATKQKLAVLQQQYDNIQKEMKETEDYSSALENKLLSKQQQIDRTAASLNQQTQRLDEMKTALQSAGVNTDHLTEESARLGRQIDDLKGKQEQAASGAQGFGTASVQAFGAIQQAIVAAGIVKALGEIKDAYMECVNAAGDFEERMSTVEALSGASADEMAALTAEAKQLGATTKFTALEAADAMGYMGMAGWSAADMLQGMDGVLQLAAASGEDLAMVSDIVTDNLTAFGLKASDTARFADVLAAAATNSNTNVSIMGETFKMSASIAGALGYSIEDVATAVGLMANSGIKGSIAGTALKNTFNGLLEGVTLTSNAFGEYEYSAVKADGTMKGFRDTLDELRIYFDQMTEAERVNNAMAIAGQRGYNGLLAILNATDEEYASLASSIDNCSGAAGRMASIKLDNMNGELTLMKSAWDALKTTLGEQFTPVMRELYAIGTQVFQGLNDFVQKHPALVKAIAAFLAVLGGVAVALSAYAVAAKVAAAASALLTAAIPGVNIIMGVTAAVAGITAGIVALISAANEGVPSVKELTVAAQDMREAMDEANATYEETATQTLATAQIAQTYIDKLDAIEKATGGNVKENQEYQNILALLSRTVPDLTYSINEETGAIQGGTEALREQTEAWKKNAEAQAYQDYVNSLYDEYSTVMAEAAENSIKLTQAQTKLEIAQKKMSDTEARMNELWAEATDKANEYYEQYGVWADATSFLSSEYYELQNSIYEIDDEIYKQEKTIKNLNKAIAEDADAVAAAEEEIRSAEDAVRELTGATEEQTAAEAEIAQQTQEVNDVINSTAEQVSALIEAYNESYTAALQSVGGQYDIWDKADKAVATSVGNINSNLESQISYWDSYNQNLESLRERAGDIEGLQEVIASFADGSTDSVNAVAGMASATDEDLAQMVANYQELQRAQEDTAQSIADLQTDFSEQMDILAENLAEDIAAMDLGNEAAEAARATINGYISQADSMLPQVQAAYGRLAQAARTALSPGGGTGRSGNGYASTAYLYNAYAEGTKSAKEGAAIVGEYGPELVYMRGGETVLPAKQTAALMAKSSNGGGSTKISLSPSYTITGSANPEELREVLREHDEALRDMVLEIVEETQVDSERRAYK